MKEVQLQGSFYEMGIQYGKECKSKIRKFAKGAYIMASLSKKPGSQPFNPNLWYIIPTLFSYKKEKIRWQNLALNYENEIAKYHPNAIDFMKGIAHGATIPYIDILSLNVATENIITCSIWGANGKSTSTGEPFIAMNADEETASQNFEVFLDINPNVGFKYKVTSLVGWTGYNHGMNETGLSIGSTLLWTKPASKRENRPPMLILMKALNECSSVLEVKSLFESVPNHDLGTVFFVADADNLLRIECTPEKKSYTIVRNGSLGNTNLFMSDELKEYDGSSLLKQTLNAHIRKLRMNDLLQKFEGKIDEKAMMKIACDHGKKGTDSYHKSICQHPKGLKYNYKTLVSYIAKPREKCFWIFEGNPCKNKVKKYAFN